MHRRGPAELLATAVVRGRWLVVAGWLAAAVFVTVSLPTIREAQVGALGDLVPRNADAVDAELRSSELFRFPLLSRTLVVQRDPDGLSAAAQARAARRALALARDEYPGLRRVAFALPVTNAVGAPPFARERSTSVVTYLFFRPEVGQDDREALAQRLIDRRIAPVENGFAGVTGAVAARSQQAEVISESLPVVELATLVLVAFVVALHFRSLGAPVVSLTAVAVAYLCSIRVIAWVGKQAGVSVPSEVEPVIVVLLFGVVTDYSIFFLSRARRGLAETGDSHAAVTQATRELLPIITTAGLAVVGASASLIVADLGFFKAFGPGIAMAVLIGLVVALTLVPALIAIGGRGLFWPRRPLPATEPTGDRGRPTADPLARRSAVQLATEHPRIVAAVTVLVLLGAASGLRWLELGNPLIRGLPEDSDARVAYQQASRGFAPGIRSPTVVIVEGEGVAERTGALRRLQGALADQRGVAAVVGPAYQPSGRGFGAVLSSTGDAARYFVVLDSDPLGARSVRRLARLRARAPGLAEEAGIPDATVLLAGDTALVSETIQKTREDLRRIAPAALAAVLLVLVVFLRALVAPLYLVAASALAVTAALGLTAYVFQGLLGFSELTYFVPFAAAVLLLSLGSDYNVFLVGDIWAEARRRPLRQAVGVAGARAATPIAVAGLVLAGSFALLALVPVRPFRELAFSMSAGLLLDAFVVRTLLVPALIVLVGTRSAWPSRLRVGARAGLSAD
jgi:RND superfamily putative drug exporter